MLGSGCVDWQRRCILASSVPANTAMQCPACKTKLREDSTHCHHCGRSLDRARMLDLFLDLGIAAALVAFSCVALLWMGF